jgi:hypothetical protein
VNGILTQPVRRRSAALCRLGLAGIAVLSGLAPVAHGEVIEIPAAADAALLEFAPDFNLGDQEDLPSGTLGPNAGRTDSRMLLRFDVATALPRGATVQAAFLRLTVTREPLGAVPSTFALHRVLQAWNEGEGQGPAPGGAPAGPGELTWNDRARGSALWSEPGGSLGADFVAQAAGREAIAGPGVYEFEFGALGVSEIQGWLAAPETNHGWMLRSEAEGTAKTARRFATREASLGSPTLLIRYLPPLPAPRLTSLAIEGDAMVLRFEAVAGVGYLWEGTSEAGQGDWTSIQRIPPTTVTGERAATNAWPALAHQILRLRIDE